MKLSPTKSTTVVPGARVTRSKAAASQEAVVEPSSSIVKTQVPSTKTTPKKKPTKTTGADKVKECLKENDAKAPSLETARGPTAKKVAFAVKQTPIKKADASSVFAALIAKDGAESDTASTFLEADPVVAKKTVFKPTPYKKKVEASTAPSASARAPTAYTASTVAPARKVATLKMKKTKLADDIADIEKQFDAMAVADAATVGTTQVIQRTTTTTTVTTVKASRANVQEKKQAVVFQMVHQVQSGELDASLVDAILHRLYDRRDPKFASTESKLADPTFAPTAFLAAIQKSG
jgi:hypothetical protein